MSLKILFRTKSIVDTTPQYLKRCLNLFDLILLGIGAVIGAGIFVLTGVAATYAGPGIILSYGLTGAACILSALSYAELAASIGGCGSAYSYAYAGLGELIAWIIGWDLLLEYGLSCSAVAIGWSGYVRDAFQALHFSLPFFLLHSPVEGGLINAPAVLIILMICVLLCSGVKYGARFNNLIVAVKLAAIFVFIGIAAFHVNPANWHPFLPLGWNGVFKGAALIFFAYIGFDAISTTAEEATQPQRDLPRAILISLLICTFLYMLVSGLLTGLAHYSQLNVSSPVTHALIQLGFHFAGALVAVGAIAGLTTVILVMYYGFTRVFLAITRDGLLPNALAKIHPKTQTPTRIIIFVAFLMSIIAGFIPIAEVAELVNIGTLAAFFIVCLGVVVLRYTRPEMPRPFKTPFSPFTPLLGAALCLFLMLRLPDITIWRFLIWLVLGIIIYFSYGLYHSKLRVKS